MNLIIVESPTKARTIQKFLDRSYSVVSSYGHVRDLPKKELGIDVQNNFQPRYVIPITSRKKITPIKKSLAKAKKVILATDEDREGEAIAWHLAQVLDLGNPKSEIRNPKEMERIVFHEITKSAIEEALKNPRQIDMDLVDAQQARRILDRLVGYELSPFLWRKVARGLSAGRVQSVAVRLIVERERKIKEFKPEEYWSIEALLKKQLTTDNQQPTTEFLALLIKKDNQTIGRLDIKSKQEADKILKDLEGAQYQVEGIEQKEIKRNPLPPFTTSTLQQEAWKKFRFSAKMTMFLAQQLYENGLITYHRTDSLSLSGQSLFAAKKFIEENHGQNYWAGFLRKFKTKSKRAQEAHEAIRPTDPFTKPQEIKNQEHPERSEENLNKLYDLIWRRFVASQMSQAVFDSMTVDIKVKNYTFRATGATMKFDGFLKVYPMKFTETNLPPLEKNEILNLTKLIPSQHFTQPPSRYSEATLIKKLEELGIGRPSTYAPIISTIQERNYIQKDETRKFFPTEIGFVVNDMLVEHFPEIIDYQFTANMEEDLDKIAAGQIKWVPVIKAFYQPFKEHLIKKYDDVSKKVFVAEPTGKICPQCGGEIVIRSSRFGKFYACKNFPKCRYTETMNNSIGLICPICKEGEVVERKTKRGKLFYGCSRYPECQFASWQKPTGEKCPKCGSPLVFDKKEKVRCSNKKCG